MQREQEIKQSEAEAEKERAKARGESDSARIRAQGEADAIKLRGEALAANPNVIQLDAIAKWNGVMPTTMVPGASVPFVPVK